MKLELKPTLDEFTKLSEKGNLIPVFVELTADYETPLSVFRKIDDGSPSFLFESAEIDNKSSRYSFLGNQPIEVFQSQSGELKKTNRKGETETLAKEGDPLVVLEERMAEINPVKNKDLPTFWGGYVGYLGYDMVRHFESTVNNSPDDDLEIPEAIFMLADSVIIFDHKHRKIQIVANVHLEDFGSLEKAYSDAVEKIENLVAQIEKPLNSDPLEAFPVELKPIEESELVSNTTKEEFIGMVNKAKEYIAAGDVFQVVPSQRFEMEFEAKPIDLYRALRHINPSPYMFCLQLGEGFSLVGSSPEVHVRAIEGKIDIRPIAGTRWRGETDEEDNRLAEELISDPKERAEHVMLVDLARNDVGRVSEYKSVEVSDLMIIEKYSHVMHIVSNVCGRLEKNKSPYDVMRATFPAGTVSGSPKVRAMQIIDELEINKRGAYAGAVGYFGYDDAHDSCITLRTCVLKNNKAYVQAGCGVVADSDPEAEYLETVNKARGMLRAVKRVSTQT